LFRGVPKSESGQMTNATRKDPTAGMRLAVEFLADKLGEQPGVAAKDLLDEVAVQAVAVALGRDPLEIAFKVANKISTNGRK
jgi:hypothetical protein